MSSEGNDLKRVIEIGTECVAITEAIEQLSVAFGNHRGDKRKMFDGPLFSSLTSRREILRLELLRINDGVSSR